ncbi:RagB/SusD family nutrient uptake outer membrane protein [Polaribacter porphyrae]|uniref:RagB/SusD family nutrient uptake outer membrane protein n=1 Tax=Polaribacter porphyrae TaxID=1137780 RepID=UPI001474B8C1|nr:RagB/SusD family nutrient uptake outer membrane protein [Polaribacter porphyrae]
MKKEYLHIITLLVLLISCDDFLEQEPNRQVSIDQQLSTKNGVLEAYNGIYRDIEGVFSGPFSTYADALGGNITFTPFGNELTVQIPSIIDRTYNFNANEQDLNFESYYDDWYKIINETNIIIERMTGFDFLTSSELNQLRAELLTIRALAHYQVSIVFAQNYNFTADASHLGVIYNTSTLLAGVDFPARETMANTYNLIKADLDEALSLYENQQLLPAVKTSYFSSISTKALYARIALQMNDWEKSKALASEVITSSGVTLLNTTNYISEWEKPIDPVSETIFEFTAPRNSDGSVSSSISAYFIFVGASTTTNLFARNVASGDLLSLYNNQDIRRNMFLEEAISTNINGIISPQNYYFTKKFQDDAGTLFIRLSEMYLIRSEANARLNNTALALSDLNIIKERANLPALQNTNNLLEEIFLERRRELAFEGHLLFDIIRYKKDVERNLGCVSVTCNLSYPSDFFILPIPFNSIQLNQNIKQNEGY